MYRLLSLASLLAVLGCTGEPVPAPAEREASEVNATTADAPFDSAVPQHVPPLSYPEKADVERLLVRAAELESNGKFEEALAIANQAVAIDPSSPTANEVKARLEELLRRIEVAPRIDERMRIPAVANGCPKFLRGLGVLRGFSVVRFGQMIDPLR